MPKARKRKRRLPPQSNSSVSIRVPLLVVGLGNPGPDYEGTRHNAGFDVVDRICEKLGGSFRRPWFRQYELCETKIGDKPIRLVKPLTYMNRSGLVFPKLLAGGKGRSGATNPADVLVICDNLDLPEGAIRLKRGGSSAGHKGLQSIIDVTQSGGFLRLYVGIGRPSAGGDVVDYVLGRVPSDRRDVLDGAVSRAVDAVIALASRTTEDVMNEVNGKRNSS